MRRNNLVQVLFKEVPPNTNYTAGRWSWVSTDTAEKYINQGYGTEWEPEEPVEAEVDTVEPKPLEGTVQQIKDWLDDNEVEYPSTALKDELIEILKES